MDRSIVDNGMQPNGHSILNNYTTGEAAFGQNTLITCLLQQVSHIQLGGGDSRSVPFGIGRCPLAGHCVSALCKFTDNDQTMISLAFTRADPLCC